MKVHSKIDSPSFERGRETSDWLLASVELRRSLFPSITSLTGATPVFFDFAIEQYVRQDDRLRLDLVMPMLWPNSQIVRYVIETEFVGFSSSLPTRIPSAPLQWIEFSQLSHSILGVFLFGTSEPYIFQFNEVIECSLRMMEFHAYTHNDQHIQIVSERD